MSIPFPRVWHARRWLTLALLLTAATSSARQDSKSDQKSAPKKSPDDQYVLGPDSQVQPGVPQGTVREFEMRDSQTFPGFERKWWIYIPVQYDGSQPAAL